MRYDRLAYIRVLVEDKRRALRPARKPGAPRNRENERRAREQRIRERICLDAWSHGPAAPGGQHCARCREKYRRLVANAKARARLARAASEVR